MNRTTEEPYGFDERSMQVVGGGERAREIQRAYRMLQEGLPTGPLDWQQIDTTLPDYEEVEHAFKDAVGNLLFAADQAGQDIRELCLEALTHVERVNAEIQQALSLDPHRTGGPPSSATRAQRVALSLADDPKATPNGDQPHSDERRT